MNYIVYSKEYNGEECEANFNDYASANEYFNRHLLMEEIEILNLNCKDGGVLRSKVVR